MKKKERDTQRRRVYKAERVLIPIARRFQTIGEVRSFVHAVWIDPNVRELFDEIHSPKALWPWPPEVKDGRGRKHAGGCADFITLPTWARTDHIILHELAHVFTQRLCGRAAAGHGWQFCQVFHRLVWVIMGENAAKVLAGSFRLHGVRMEPSQRRIRRRASASASATPAS